MCSWSTVTKKSEERQKPRNDDGREKCNKHANSKRTWEPGTYAECACKTQTVHLHYESQGGGEINSPHVHCVVNGGGNPRQTLTAPTCIR